MKQKHYPIPEVIKRQIVDEYLTTDITQRELLERYKIRGKNIQRWIRKFGAEIRDPQALDLDTMAKTTKVGLKETDQGDPISPFEEVERLRREIEKLKEELDYERLRVEALDTMINLAEDHFQIPIRKKSGAKQSKL